MDDLGKLVTALSDDEEIRAAIKALALGAIAEAQALLDDGIPSVKMQVIRSVLPALTKALQQQDGKDMNELKSTVGDMYALIAGQIAQPS